jgi:hypothetical protein
MVEEERTMSFVSREDIITAARKFIEKGITDPDVIEQDPDGKKLWGLYGDWAKQETDKMSTLSIDEAIPLSIEVDTIWYDAGFTDPKILTEIVDEDLIQTLSLADSVHRKDLADKVIAKMHEIGMKIKEQDPTYQLFNPQIELEDWNPSRIASPKEFYDDYSYYFGTDKSNIDEVVKLYLRYHPEADPVDIRIEMQKK